MPDVLVDDERGHVNVTATNNPVAHGIVGTWSVKKRRGLGKIFRGCILEAIALALER